MKQHCRFYRAFELTAWPYLPPLQTEARVVEATETAQTKGGNKKKHSMLMSLRSSLRSKRDLWKSPSS